MSERLLERRGEVGKVDRYKTAAYQQARAEAQARSKGLCQACGQRPGVEAHHYRYPLVGTEVADDLTWLCSVCHSVVTAIRRFEGNIWQFKQVLEEASQRMLYDVRIEGETALIQHSRNGLLPGNAITKEIKTSASKRGTNRTESDDARLRQLETINSLWREWDTITIPPQASDLA